MATALDIWQREQDQHARHLRLLRDRFEAGLRAGLPNIVVHGAGAARLPQTSNVAFPGLDGQVLLMALDLAGRSVLGRRGCSSGSDRAFADAPGDGIAQCAGCSSLRFSFGATNTKAEIDEAVRRIVHVCGELRA